MKKILGFAIDVAGILFFEIFFFRYGGGDTSSAICLSWFIMGIGYLFNAGLIKPNKSSVNSIESGVDMVDKFFNKYMAGMFFQGGIYLFMETMAEVDVLDFSNLEVFVHSFFWYFGIAIAHMIIKELRELTVLEKITGTATDVAGVLFVEIFFFKYEGIEMVSSMGLSWFLLGCGYLINAWLIKPNTSNSSSVDSGVDMVDKFFNKYMAGMTFQGGVYMLMSLLAEIDALHSSPQKVFVQSFFLYFIIHVAYGVVGEIEKIKKGY